MTENDHTKETVRNGTLYCSTHGAIRKEEAISLDTSRGVKYQCPTCKAFLSPTPPENRKQIDAGRQGIVPSEISGQSLNHYCSRCGNVGERIRIQPTKSGILRVCEACGSNVVPIDDQLLANLPPPPDEEPLFPDEPDSLAISGGAGLDFSDVEAGRLQEVLSHSGVSSKKLSFVLRVFTGTPAYRNPESLFSFLNSMGLGAARSKIASDYVFASSTPQPPGPQGSPPPAGYPSGMGGLRDRLIEASIVAKELQLLGLAPSGSVGVDAKGNPIIQPTQGTTPEDLFRYFSQGMEMAIKLGGGQGTSLEEEIARVKAIQGLTSPTTESAEVAGIYGRVELEKLKEQRRHEMALAKQADDREAAARSQATVDGAVKVGLEVVKEIAEPLGATLAGGVKNLTQQGQQQQQQGPTPANQLTPEQRAEVLQKISEMEGQLEARRAEVMSQGDGPSVQMEKVEVMREGDHANGGS